MHAKWTDPDLVKALVGGVVWYFFLFFFSASVMTRAGDFFFDFFLDVRSDETD